MKNNYNKKTFEKDIKKFLNSKFAKNLTVLVDSRVVDLGFKIPVHEDVVHTSTGECLKLLKANNKQFVCLTIGTSYWFPSIGDNDWVNESRKQPKL